MILALFGNDWSSSHPTALPARKDHPRTLPIGGWVASSVLMDAVEKRRVFDPPRYRTLIPRLSSP